MAPEDLSAVTIVVLSHNRKDALEPNLPRLVRMVEENGCELIVVDNASTDGSVEMIREVTAGRHGVKAILNGRNLGVAGGRNSGWLTATREFILNVDDDTLVTLDAVAMMLALLRNRPEVGIVSPRILHARTGAAQLDFGNSEYRLTNFHGACHMVRAALLNKIGLNDEACSFGGEELDLSIRTRAVGQEVVYTPAATVMHDNRARQGQEGSERLARWLYNFVRVHHKHFPRGTATLLSGRYLVSYLVAGVRSKGPLFACALVHSAWRGRLDGLRRYRRVPKDVVAFYSAPAHLPDIGNVPLYRKLLGKRSARLA